MTPSSPTPKICIRRENCSSISAYIISLPTDITLGEFVEHTVPSLFSRRSLVYSPVGVARRDASDTENWYK
jgi:hypothetical protein